MPGEPLAVLPRGKLYHKLLATHLLFSVEPKSARGLWFGFGADPVRWLLLTEGEHRKETDGIAQQFV